MEISLILSWIPKTNKHKIKNNNDKRNPIYNLQTHKKGNNNIK